MKRPGKPDTGNPFVRFDEERGDSVELTTTAGLIRPLPLRLLYHLPVEHVFPSGGAHGAGRPALPLISEIAKRTICG